MTSPPEPNESLASYIRRLRISTSLTQNELANRARIHLQSLGKIETGKTTRLNQKTLRGLAYALSIPVEYLSAVCKGVPVSTNRALKFCPRCWTPGTPPDPMWTEVRSLYCFACGNLLRSSCSTCNEPIMSLQFRFCPYCGQSYNPHSAPSTVTQTALAGGSQ